MEQIVFEQLTYILEMIGQEFNKGIVIVDKNLKIAWINSIIGKKGFRLSEIIGVSYHKVFENIDAPDEKDSTYIAVNTGRTTHTIKKGKDSKDYHVVSIPIKNESQTVEYVLEFTKSLDEQKSNEIQSLKEFIFERELKMAELKKRIKELENPLVISQTNKVK